MALDYTPATLPENIKNKDKNKLIYTPSGSAATIERPPWKGWDIRWWGPNAPFQHNSLLISAFYGMKDWDFREKWEVPTKDFLFFADSGGFQILKQNIYVDPVDILKWMEHNTDVGVMVDVPPDNEMTATINPEFEKRAKRSLENYETMVRNRQSEDFQLYKPIHGGEIEPLNWWYKYVNDVPCDGYAIATRSVTPRDIALALGFAINKGMEDFHLFFGSGFNTIPIIIYASQYIKNLSFDSSSFSLRGGKLRQYVLPLYFQNYINFGRRFDGKLTDLPCFCPVCDKIKNIEDLNIESAESAGMILLHDLYTYLMPVKVLSALIKDKETYREVIRKNYNAEVLKYIDVIDQAAEGNFEDYFRVEQKKGVNAFF